MQAFYAAASGDARVCDPPRDASLKSAEVAAVTPPTCFPGSPTPYILTSGGRSVGTHYTPTRTKYFKFIRKLLVALVGEREAAAATAAAAAGSGKPSSVQEDSAGSKETATSCHLIRLPILPCRLFILQSHLYGLLFPLTGREAGSVKGVTTFFGIYLAPFPPKEPGHTLRRLVPLLVLSTRVYANSFPDPRAMVSSPQRLVQRIYLSMCLTLRGSMSQ